MDEMTGRSDDECERMFAAAVQLAGLTLEETEAGVLLEGYRGLQELLARIPRDLPAGLEPDIVAVTPGGRIVR